MNLDPITPQNITEEERDILVPFWNRQLEAKMMPIYGKLSKASTLAAAAQDRDRLLEVRQAAQAYASQLSNWNDGWRERASATLRLLEAAFSSLADDIGATVNGELPGQADTEGDEWKQ